MRSSFDQLKRIFNFEYKGFLVWKAFLILAATSLLSIPSPFSYTNSFSFSNTYQIACVPGQESQEVEFNTVAEPLGASSLSRLTSIQLLSMPIEICLGNQNKIFLDGMEKQPNELLDGKEGGAMAVKFSYMNGGGAAEVYASKGQTQCKLLEPGFKKALFNNQVEIRQVYPAGNAEFTIKDGSPTVQAKMYSNASIDTSESFITFKTKFSWGVLVTNFIFCLFGISLLLMGLQYLMSVIRKKPPIQDV